jgi:adenylate cyclase
MRDTLVMAPIPDICDARILIVDDQEANVLLLRRILHSAGYGSVQSTTDPTDVCDRHRANRYDLILLDLRMPVMNGFQVIEGLKQIEEEGYLPVIVITADPEQKLRALKAGAKDFINKPFDLAEVLVRVHNMLEVRLLHRDMKHLYDQVVAEQSVSERLLLNVLPEAIARRLKGRAAVTGDSFTEVIADSFPEVTVLFADIVGFTKFSEGVSPEMLVDVLNDIFTGFDSIADHRGLEKIKTIGDAYMAAAGLPVPARDHRERAAHMALDMLEVMDRFNERSLHQLSIRVGISTGAAVAGVIGKRKFLYDLWGDVVNTASRMTSHGVPGRIHLTNATHNGLGAPFVSERRGTIVVKGKGEMETWFLTGRSGAPGALPWPRSGRHMTPAEPLRLVV